MRGFSLIEIMITAVVVIALVAVIANAFLKFRDSQNLNNASQKVFSLINEARAKTLASSQSSQYGVRFEGNRAILFKGTVFSESDPENEELIISYSVEISAIALNGGGSDLIFQKLTGKTEQYGSVTLRAKNDPAKTKIINIAPTGVVELQ